MCAVNMGMAMSRALIIWPHGSGKLSPGEAQKDGKDFLRYKYIKNVSVCRNITVVFSLPQVFTA